MFMKSTKDIIQLMKTYFYYRCFFIKFEALFLKSDYLFMTQSRGDVPVAGQLIFSMLKYQYGQLKYCQMLLMTVANFWSEKYHFAKMVIIFFLCMISITISR